MLILNMKLSLNSKPIANPVDNVTVRTVITYKADLFSKDVMLRLNCFNNLKENKKLRYSPYSKLCGLREEIL
jgi:hypothetical protein